MDIKYNNNYLIYPNGDVWSKKRKKFLTKNRLTADGYRRVALRVDGKPKGFSVHRLVAEHYISNPNNLPVVDHINRNRLDNRVENLRWFSISGNVINRPLQPSNLSGFRHIFTATLKLKGKEYHYWYLTIYRDKKRVINKCYTKKKHTLEDVVNIRNEFYNELNIEIDDC
jgi:hypothetical protein